MNPLSILAEGMTHAQLSTFIEVLDNMVTPRQGLVGLSRTRSVLQLLHDELTAAAKVEELRANGWQDDTALADYLTGRLQPQAPETPEDSTHAE